MSRAARWLVTLNLLAITAALLVVMLTSRSPTPLCVLDNNCDALIFRSVADVLGTSTPYRTWDAGGVSLGFAYPPWTLPLFALYAHGRLAMLALGAVSAGALWALARRHGEVFALVAVGGGWTFFCVWLGQTGLLMGVAGFLLLTRARGLGLALLMLKPQYAPLVVVALCLDRRWRDVAIGLALPALGAAAATAWLGPGIWTEWGAQLTQAPPELDRSFMSSWQAWAPASLATDPRAAGAVLALGGAAVLASPVRGEQRLALALALALVVSPHSHPYDLALWAPIAARTSRPVRDLSVLAAISHAAILTGLRAFLPVAGLWLAWRLLETRPPLEPANASPP